MDDESSLRESLGIYLRSKGHTVLLASSGNEALAILKDTKVDFILSDMHMPDGNGTELLIQLKQIEQSDIPIIIYSGNSDDRREEILSMGAMALFEKPLDLENLEEMMENKAPPDLC